MGVYKQGVGSPGGQYPFAGKLSFSEYRTTIFGPSTIRLQIRFQDMSFRNWRAKPPILKTEVLGFTPPGKPIKIKSVWFALFQSVKHLICIDFT